MNKKCIIVTIVDGKDKRIPINILVLPIRCSANDESAIKHAIESRKNDPNVLAAIMMQDVPKSVLPKVKPALDEVKKLIEGCESIDVSFLDFSEIEKFIQTHEKKSILHNFSQN
jgi:hypothetical protein